MNHSLCCSSCAFCYGTELLAWLLSFELFSKTLWQSAVDRHFCQTSEPILHKLKEKICFFKVIEIEEEQNS